MSSSIREHIKQIVRYANSLKGFTGHKGYGSKTTGATGFNGATGGADGGGSSQKKVFFQPTNKWYVWSDKDNDYVWSRWINNGLARSFYSADKAKWEAAQAEEARRQAALAQAQNQPKPAETPTPSTEQQPAEQASEPPKPEPKPVPPMTTSRTPQPEPERQPEPEPKEEPTTEPISTRYDAMTASEIFNTYSDDMSEDEKKEFFRAWSQKFFITKSNKEKHRYLCERFIQFYNSDTVPNYVKVTAMKYAEASRAFSKHGRTYNNINGIDDLRSSHSNRLLPSRFNSFDIPIRDHEAYFNNEFDDIPAPDASKDDAEGSYWAQRATGHRWAVGDGKTYKTQNYRRYFRFWSLGGEALGSLGYYMKENAPYRQAFDSTREELIAFMRDHKFRKGTSEEEQERAKKVFNRYLDVAAMPTTSDYEAKGITYAIRFAIMRSKREAGNFEEGNVILGTLERYLPESTIRLFESRDVNLARMNAERRAREEAMPRPAPEPKKRTRAKKPTTTPTGETSTPTAAPAEPTAAAPKKRGRPKKTSESQATPTETATPTPTSATPEPTTPEPTASAPKKRGRPKKTAELQTAPSEPTVSTPVLATPTKDSAKSLFDYDEGNGVVVGTPTATNATPNAGKKPDQKTIFDFDNSGGVTVGEPSTTSATPKKKRTYKPRRKPSAPDDNVGPTIFETGDAVDQDGNQMRPETRNRKDGLFAEAEYQNNLKRQEEEKAKQQAQAQSQSQQPTPAPASEPEPTPAPEPTAPAATPEPEPTPEPTPAEPAPEKPAAEPPKRKRGRPRKNPLPETPSESQPEQPSTSETTASTAKYDPPFWGNEFEPYLCGMELGSYAREFNAGTKRESSDAMQKFMAPKLYNICEYAKSLLAAPGRKVTDGQIEAAQNILKAFGSTTQDALSSVLVEKINATPKLAPALMGKIAQVCKQMIPNPEQNYLRKDEEEEEKREKRREELKKSELTEAEYRSKELRLNRGLHNLMQVERALKAKKNVPNDLLAKVFAGATPVLRQLNDAVAAVVETDVPATKSYMPRTEQELASRDLTPILDALPKDQEGWRKYFDDANISQGGKNADDFLGTMKNIIDGAINLLTPEAQEALADPRMFTAAKPAAPTASRSDDGEDISGFRQTKTPKPTGWGSRIEEAVKVETPEETQQPKRGRGRPRKEKVETSATDASARSKGRGGRVKKGEESKADREERTLAETNNPGLARFLAVYDGSEDAPLPANTLVLSPEMQKELDAIKNERVLRRLMQSPQQSQSAYDQEKKNQSLWNLALARGALKSIQDSLSKPESSLSPDMRIAVRDYRDNPKVLSDRIAAIEKMLPNEWLKDDAAEEAAKEAEKQAKKAAKEAEKQAKKAEKESGEKTKVRNSRYASADDGAPVLKYAAGYRGFSSAPTRKPSFYYDGNTYCYSDKYGDYICSFWTNDRRVVKRLMDAKRENARKYMGENVAPSDVGRPYDDEDLTRKYLNVKLPRTDWGALVENPKALAKELEEKYIVCNPMHRIADKSYNDSITDDSPKWDDAVCGAIYDAICPIDNPAYDAQEPEMIEIPLGDGTFLQYAVFDATAQIPNDSDVPYAFNDPDDLTKGQALNLIEELDAIKNGESYDTDDANAGDAYDDPNKGWRSYGNPNDGDWGQFAAEHGYGEYSDESTRALPYLEINTLETFAPNILDVFNQSVFLIDESTLEQLRNAKPIV